MLVHWDHSASELSALDINDVEALIAELIRVRRLGYHLVSISRQTIEWIRNNLNSSAFLMTQLGAFHREYTQTGNLRAKARIYIEISSFNHDFEVRQNNCILTSVKFLIRSGILEKPKLILENIDNDGWLFDFVMSNVRGLKQFPDVTLQRLHGGGGDVTRVLNYEIKTRNMVCLLMDSDRKHPHQAKTDKVEAAETACASANWPFAFVFSTPCHEIENLLPFSLVSEITKLDAEPTIKCLQTIFSFEDRTAIASFERYWRWFDIKKGYTQKIRQEMKPDAREWHDGRIQSSFNGPINCFGGFGEYLIQRISADNSLQSKLAKALNSIEWQPDFRDMFSQMAWIFAAQRKTIT